MPRKPRGRSVTRKRTPPAKRGGSAADRKLPVPPEELERAVASALQKVEVSAIISEKFAGPLPHPEHLQQYEAIQPGLADRIVTMTEKQLEHSHKMESRIVNSNLKVEARGQWFAQQSGTASLATAPDSDIPKLVDSSQQEK